MKAEIQKEWYSVEQCKANPRKLYVFGDNVFRKGNRGQAVIRNCTNSIGVATKILPSTTEESYFTGIYDEYQIVANDLSAIINEYFTGNYDMIVFPADGLGTGLSELQTRAPELLEWMNFLISTIFEIEYNPK